MSDGNVVAAIAKVVGELPAIGKGGQASAQQGGYSYRGIEQITKEAAPLFAKYGVVFVPRVTNVEIRDLTVNNKPWTDTILTVAYRICGPGGPEDYVEAVVVGIGRDNSDKGANKALTQAFKYVLTQTLCIADGRDDGDGQTHEADGPVARVSTSPGVVALRARVEALYPEVRADFTAWKDDQGFPWPWPPDAVAAMDAHLDEIARSGEPSPDTDQLGTDVPFPPTSASSPERGGYDLWRKDDLLAECIENKIDLDGKKTNEQLVALLREWDATYRPGYVEPAERPF